MAALADNLPTNSAGRASVAPRKLSLRRQESERQLWVDYPSDKSAVSINALIDGRRNGDQLSPAPEDELEGRGVTYHMGPEAFGPQLQWIPPMMPSGPVVSNFIVLSPTLMSCLRLYWQR